MESEFARDLADQNQPIYEAASERPGKPLKLRLQPMILTARQYRAWRDVSWTLACESPEEIFAVRDAMKVFFAALAAHGPATVSSTLHTLLKEDAA